MHIPPIIIEHKIISRLFFDEMASLYQFHWTVLLEFNACLMEYISFTLADAYFWYVLLCKLTWKSDNDDKLVKLIVSISLI